MKLCRGCYKLAVSMAMLFPPFTTNDTKDFEFIPNHSECDCCRGQVERMKVELAKAIAKYPDFPMKLRATFVKCCCH